MKATLTLLIVGFLGTPLMVVFMNHQSGKAYTAIQERLQEEDRLLQKQMVRIEIKEEPTPKGTDLFARVHLTIK